MLREFGDVSELFEEMGSIGSAKALRLRPICSAPAQAALTMAEAPAAEGGEPPKKKRKKEKPAKRGTESYAVGKEDHLRPVPIAWSVVSTLRCSGHH